MKIKLVSSLILVLALLVLSSPVYAIPALPHAFYGDVTVNGSPATDGTLVSATVSEGEIIPTQNPVTTEGGSYGTTSLKLLVQGNDLSGDITFYVNGRQATPSRPVTFMVGGGPSRIDLSVTIEAPPPPLPAYVETTLFGVERSFRISPGGEIQQTIEATSEDEMLTLTITAGTIALDKYGKALTNLAVAVDPSPPDPPEGSYLIGAYDFSPAGATFNPPINLTWSYDPDALPEGVSEEDLVIGYYDEAIDDWAWVPCGINTATNTVSALVSHFTTFAMIGTVTPVPTPPVPPTPPAPAAFSLANLTITPALVNPGEMVTISVSVANTGDESGSYNVVLKINGVIEEGKRVTVAAGTTEMVTFSVTKEDPASYSVAVDGLSASFTVVAPLAPPPPPPPAPPAKEVNWPLIGGIIIGVILVGLFIFFLVRRRD